MDKEITMPTVIEPDDEDLQESRIKLLDPKKQRFIHLYLGGSHKLQDIATLLNLHVGTLRNWLSRPDVRKIIDEYQAQEDEIVKQGLKALSMKAMYRMSELVDSKIDGIAYQAAKDILDRTGHKPTTKQEVNVEVTFEQQIKELAKQTGVIDVDFEDVDK